MSLPSSLPLPLTGIATMPYPPLRKSAYMPLHASSGEGSYMSPRHAVLPSLQRVMPSHAFIFYDENRSRLAIVVAPCAAFAQVFVALPPPRLKMLKAPAGGARKREEMRGERTG